MAIVLTSHAHKADLPSTPEHEACARLLWVNSAYNASPTVSELKTANEWWKQLTHAQKDFASNLTQSPRFRRFALRHNIDLNRDSPDLIGEIYGTRFLNEMRRSWGRISEGQRDAVLSLELMKIQPPPEPDTDTNIPPHHLNGREWLKTLSRANKTRLLAQLLMRYPLPAGVARNGALLATAAKMSEELNFQFIQRHQDDGQFSEMENPPLVSDREMTSIGWRGNASYYSDLLGGSSTVNFTVEAVRGDQPFYNLHSHAAQVGLALNRDMALRHGLMLPHFVDLKDVVDFLLNWDQDVLARVFQRNRLVLPSSMVTPESFAWYLGYGDLQRIFQNTELYGRFAPVRQSLHRYVMTVEDGETFLREAFARYLLSQNQRLNRDQNKHFAFLQWKMNGGAQSMYAIPFQQWLGMTGVEVRVPVAVSSDDYSILHLQPRRYGGIGD